MNNWQEKIGIVIIIVLAICAMVILENLISNI
jgi:hypothetical protein